MYQAKLIAIFVAIGTILQVFAELAIEKFSWEINHYLLVFICYGIGWICAYFLMKLIDPRTQAERNHDQKVQDKLDDQKFDYKLLDGKKHRKKKF